MSKSSTNTALQRMRFLKIRKSREWCAFGGSRRTKNEEWIRRRYLNVIILHQIEHSILYLSVCTIIARNSHIESYTNIDIGSGSHQAPGSANDVSIAISSSFNVIIAIIYCSFIICHYYYTIYLQMFRKLRSLIQLDACLDSLTRSYLYLSRAHTCS